MRQRRALAENGMYEARNASTGTIYVPEGLRDRLWNWFDGPTSSMRWIEGPEPPSDLSPLALNIMNVNLRLTPCIWFFDKRQYREETLSGLSRLTFEQAGLTNLLWSAAHQLTAQVPWSDRDLENMQVRFRCDLLYAPSEFDLHIEDELEMVKTLLARRTQRSGGPRKLAVIIDGIQAFDTPQTRPHIQKLVDILRDQGTKALVKVLFTTDGPCRALSERLREYERLTFEKPMVAGECPEGYMRCPGFW
jgi:hypothetical protein